MFLHWAQYTAAAPTDNIVINKTVNLWIKKLQNCGFNCFPVFNK